MGSILDIKYTLEVVSKCWRIAESKLRDDIRESCPNVDEEFITRLFHGELTKTLKEASQDHSIEQAFLADLRQAFPGLNSGDELGGIANGLVADVTLHRRITEKASGGDIGLVIIRPQVADYGHVLKVDNYRCGLLCQAKIRRVTGRWGGFTKRQKEVLPQRLKYLALLLYDYEDEARRVLGPFQWQLCDSAASFQEVEHWVRHSDFPSLVRSDIVVEGVGRGHIGTDDDKVIDEIISPARNPSLTITISWPEGQHPGSHVWVWSREVVQEEVRSYVYIRG